MKTVQAGNADHVIFTVGYQKDSGFDSY